MILNCGDGDPQQNAIPSWSNPQVRSSPATMDCREILGGGLSDEDRDRCFVVFFIDQQSIIPGY